MSATERTLSVRLSGGFGNQLFQYCAGLAVSQRWGRRLVLDRSWYRISNYKPRRPFRLDCYALPEASFRANAPADLARLLIDQGVRRSAIVRHLLKAMGIAVIVERNGHIKCDELYRDSPLQPYVSLSGFWQTIDHFLIAGKQMEQTLRPKFPRTRESLDLEARVADSDSAFLHIRRGDFVSLGHPLLPLSYYENAVSEIEGKTSKSLNWFVFSDDPDWCRSALGCLRRVEFVGLSSLFADLEEFEIMRACRHGIVANSSFSWWAAALIRNPEAIVCAPRNRYGSAGGAELQRERVLPAWTLVE